MRYLILFLTLLWGCKEAVNETTARMHPIARHTDDYFTALTNLRNFNGVVLVFDRDSVLFQKNYNIYPDPDSSTFISINHQFDIHSVSKLMARALITNLEKEGKLSTDQTLEEFYLEFPRGDEITLEMLVKNRSGLPRELLDFEGFESNLTPDEIIREVEKQDLLFDPGTEVQYSNIGFEVVYDIIADSYDTTFSQSLVNEVFIPLEMKNTGAWFYTNGDRPGRPAQNHVLRDSVMVPVPSISEDEFKTARVYSTAADLHRFMLMLTKEPYASALKDEDDIIEKTGGSRGVRAQAYVDTQSGLGYIFLANYDEMPFNETIDNMAKILRSQPFELPRAINRLAINLPAETMKRYEGTYRFADFDGIVISVAVEGDTLALYQNGKKIGSLRAESETVFFENPNAAESMEFVPNDSGSYNAMMGWKGIVVEGERIFR